MKFKQVFFLAVAATCILSSYAEAHKTPLTVIFETDMGNDIDDVLALDMLYKYQDAGVIKIAAISNNKGNNYSIPFIDLLNRWYGYPNIPLGNVEPPKIREGKKISYVEYVSNLKNEQRSDLFERKLSPGSTVEGSVAMYRRILSGQPDKSVVIISVGFLTNLSRLLNSPADKYSPLNGKELINKKVKFMSLMGGDFRSDRSKEFNIRYDIAAAKDVFSNWPGDIFVSPWELGGAVVFPGDLIKTELGYTPAHPLKQAYEYYLTMPYDRPTWDLTSVLYAVEPLKQYFKVSKAGFIETDDKGATFFNKSKKGNRYILTADKRQQETMLLRFKALVQQKPKL
ncbi:nucleoside hydrolase [Pedobacter nyackensis]|uniref:Inosine-uridine nucleoside N-ribohydrolase n=1 Tax=Pedobacter nyackensis TaxID=475255 RepID=A0A1W2D1A9_9SPHI|nr:nucleoside hydrolase [Pedobacter nyackensis]SMC91263.1 Inosine-uridine nucleoside N-ribohydrolase [Pedobacter nyackensis]